MPSFEIRRYLEKRSFPGPWHLEGAGGRDFAGAVVIPALAEEKYLGDTLASLAGGSSAGRAGFLVVVVVNHRCDAHAAGKEENFRTLRRLAAGVFDQSGLAIAWVDAASPGREIPAGEGVGLARKIGFDLALTRLDYGGASPILASLDADTLVDADYFPALRAHFRLFPQGGAVLPFRHQGGTSPAEEEAIVRYELFLRGYVLGLAMAGSPYAFHTIGSAIACRADAYVRAGGMNRRQAAEDFYFLQQLAKSSGVGSLTGTVVRPSARPSTRVPFGTGRAVSRWLAENAAVSCYPAAGFRLLARFLALVARSLDASAEEITGEMAIVSPAAGAYLRAARFSDAWTSLQRNHRRHEHLRRAFHVWFDGLRTVRFLRHLATGEMSRQAAEEAIPPLLAWAGYAASPSLADQLETLRRLQGAARD